MKKIISAVSKISVASAANIFSGIIRTKVFAIILGTVGVGIISQLTTFTNLVIFISSAGIPIGVTKYVSEWEKEGKWSEINEIVSRSLQILVLAGIIFLAAAVIFSKQISFLILDSSAYSDLVIVSACTFPFAVMITVLEAFLRGLKKFDQYVKISVLIALFSLLISIILVIYFNVVGFVISTFISSIFSVLVYLFFFSKNRIYSIKSLFTFNYTFSDALKSILKLGAASLVLGILDQATLLFIRSQIIRDLGVESNGIYQCVVGISNNYFMLFYMSLGAYILPILSEMKDKQLMNDEINNTYRLTLLLIVPIITLTFVLREYIVITLYTAKFLPATDLMVYNFTGDFFKALSWVLGAWLIPRSKIRLWLVLGILYYINYVLIFMILNLFGNNIKNVVFAYSIAGIIHFAVNLVFIKKFNEFRFRPDSFRLMLISSVILMIVMSFSAYQVYYGYIAAIPLLIIWVKIAVKKDEFFKLLNLLKIRK